MRRPYRARWRHRYCLAGAPCAGWPSAPGLAALVVCFANALLACPDACTCPASSSHVTCTSAGLTAIPRGMPPSLTTLDLSGNELHALSAAALAPLRNAVNLKLKDNDIETVHDGAFEPLQSLQTLDLGSNRLTALGPLTFQGAAGLLHLDLSGNRIATLDGAAFAGMAQLSRLDLRKNDLTEIRQETFSELVNLRYLLLAENRISRIDRRAFKNLEKITYLVLKGNPISEVPRFQFNSFYLSYVDLSECGLTHVPRGLPNSIRYLQLRRNNITVVRHHSFQDCPFISILVLDENGITEISERTFEHMTYLQQLWLNNNNLRRLPRRLPVSLQRLLMDQNQVEAIGDPFPAGSQLHTLSLMGNNVSELDRRALGRAPLLQSVDLSNNQLRHVHGQAFANCSRLETLQLSKNPLQYFHGGCFDGLRAIQTLSLAYIPTVVSMADDVFDDLDTITKLDLDSSHWIIRTILASDRLLSALGSVEDLSMQGADLTTLRPDFFRFLPQLAMFHVSSARWHCDGSLVFLRNWLLTTDVQVARRDEITCLTPRELYGRSLTSLADHEFAPTTTPTHVTDLPTAPPLPSTPPPSSPTTPPSEPPTAGTTAGGAASTSGEEQDAGGYDEDYSVEESADEEPSRPVLDFDEIFSEIYGSYDGGSPDRPFSSRYPTWEELMRQATRTPPTNPPADTPYDPERPPGGEIQIRPLPDAGQSGPAPGVAGEPDDPETEPSTSTLVIIVATTISTIVIAGVLIGVIVYLSRKNRDRQNRGRAKKAKRKAKPKPKPKREAYQNGIKYKSRNDVLYFMPKNSDGGTSDSLQTTASKEAMSLVPGRDINHEGPLRVYKWEDF